MTLIEASVFKLTVVFLVCVDSANVVMPDRAEVNVCRLKILEEFQAGISKNIYFDKKSTKLDLLPSNSFYSWTRVKNVQPAININNLTRHL